jgi:hypothetical protein
MPSPRLTVFSDVFKLAAFFFQAGSSTRMWRALNLPPLAAANLSYLAFKSASVTIFRLKVGEQLTDHDGLAGQFHLHLEVIASRRAFQLPEDFTVMTSRPCILA